MANILRIARVNLTHKDIKAYEKRAKELALSVTEANLTKHASDMMYDRNISMESLIATLNGTCAEASRDFGRDTVTVLMNSTDEKGNIIAVSFDYYSLSIISAFARYLGKGVGVNPNNYFGV